MLQCQIGSWLQSNKQQQQTTIKQFQSAISELLFASVSKRVLMRNHSYEMSSTSVFIAMQNTLIFTRKVLYMYGDSFWNWGKKSSTRKWPTVHFNRALGARNCDSLVTVNLLTSKENDTTCGWKVSFIRIDKWSQTQIFHHQLVSPCLIQQLLYFKTH